MATPEAIVGLLEAINNPYDPRRYEPEYGPYVEICAQTYEQLKSEGKDFSTSGTMAKVAALDAFLRARSKPLPLQRGE